VAHLHLAADALGLGDLANEQMLLFHCFFRRK
jgi:hypothetical protein